jgi:hypothetical protein
LPVGIPHSGHSAQLLANQPITPVGPSWPTDCSPQ